MTDDELMLFEEMAAARGLGILAQRLILDYNRRGAEADRLRELNAELMRKIDSACITLGLGLGDVLPGQRSVGAREWREIAERAYQSLKADTKPQPKA